MSPDDAKWLGPVILVGGLLGGLVWLILLGIGVCVYGYVVG